MSKNEMNEKGFGKVGSIFGSLLDFLFGDRHSLLEFSFLNFRKAFQLEFGAYRGLAGILKSHSNPRNCSKKEKVLKKGIFFVFCAKLWYAPNPGSKEPFSSEI